MEQMEPKRLERNIEMREFPTPYQTQTKTMMTCSWSMMERWKTFVLILIGDPQELLSDPSLYLRP